MTDHAALLKQIRADARPYVEQALDLAEVFTGFRKLASENGLDWGVIKQLIKAELQDEKEGGDEKVSRIIEKADFASAYADMLGLGSAKMNENNFSSEPVPVPSETEAGQDEDAERQRPSFEGAMVGSSSVAPPINPEAKATEVEPGNAGGLDGAVRQNNDRAVLQVGSSAGRTADLQPGGGIAGHLSQPIAEVPPLSSSEDPGPIPAFLDRRRKEAA